jgi:hypothetical protein
MGKSHPPKNIDKGEKMLQLVKTDDGFWLIIDTGEKQASINLGFRDGIVGDVLEEAAEQGRAPDENLVDLPEPTLDGMKKYFSKKDALLKHFRR